MQNQKQHDPVGTGGGTGTARPRLSAAEAARAALEALGVVEADNAAVNAATAALQEVKAGPAQSRDRDRDEYDHTMCPECGGRSPDCPYRRGGFRYGR